MLGSCAGSCAGSCGLGCWCVVYRLFAVPSAANVHDPPEKTLTAPRDQRIPPYLLGSACVWLQSIALYSHCLSESVCSPAMMILQHTTASTHLSETCRNGVPRHHKSGIRPLPAPFQTGCLSQMAATRTRRPNLTTAAVAAPDQSAALEQEAEAAPHQQPEVAPAPADAAEPAAPSYDIPKLADLQLQAIINPKVCPFVRWAILPPPSHPPTLTPIQRPHQHLSLQLPLPTGPRGTRDPARHSSSRVCCLRQPPEAAVHRIQQGPESLPQDSTGTAARQGLLLQVSAVWPNPLCLLCCPFGCMSA